MKLVIDTSVILAVLMGEPSRDELIALTQGAQLTAPECMQHEIVNALSAMFKQSRISIGEASEILERSTSIPIHYIQTSADHALHMAHSQRIYAYDAYFLCCALSQRVPLLSLDKKLNKIAHTLGISTKERMS